MDVLEIRYENGHMTINVPVYFPCLQKNARKLFPLIKRYCTGDDRAALGRYLYLLRAFCRLRWRRETASPAYRLIGSTVAGSSHTAWRSDGRSISGRTATTGFIANWR